jgi:hypothetical protein
MIGSMLYFFQNWEYQGEVLAASMKVIHYFWTVGTAFYGVGALVLGVKYVYAS